MIHDSDVNFRHNVDCRLKKMASMNIILVVRPTAVNVGERLPFLRTSNIA
jgi:hypothetical protein